MCQLLGVSSNNSVNIEFSLKEFQCRGERNPHGFGFAFYQAGEVKIIKEPKPLSSVDVTGGELSFSSKIIIGHVRLASCGRKKHENTHPFKQEKWCFAHNGTVSEIKSFSLERFKPEGETDSEYAFCYLLDRIFQKSELDEIVNVLKDESTKITQFGRFNYVMSDGEHLFAFGDDSLYFVKREFPFQKVTLRDTGYCLELVEIKAPNEKAIIIATEPLTKEENWNPIKGLKVFKDGEEIKV